MYKVNDFFKSIKKDIVNVEINANATEMAFIIAKNEKWNKKIQEQIIDKIIGEDEYMIFYMFMNYLAKDFVQHNYLIIEDYLESYIDIAISRFVEYYLEDFKENEIK